MAAVPIKDSGLTNPIRRPQNGTVVLPTLRPADIAPTGGRGAVGGSPVARESHLLWSGRGDRTLEALQDRGAPETAEEDLEDLLGTGPFRRKPGAWVYNRDLSNTLWQREEQMQEIRHELSLEHLPIEEAEAEQRDASPTALPAPVVPAAPTAPVPVVRAAPAPQFGPIEERVFEARFDGSDEKLSSFLLRMDWFLEDWGPTFVSEADSLRLVGRSLDGQAEEWWVDQNVARAPSVANVALFREALQARFRDPLRTAKARESLRQLEQGGRPVFEYILDLRCLFRKLRTLSEEEKIDAFKMGLDRSLFAAIYRQWPPMDGNLEAWFLKAGQVEDNQREYELWKQ
ncbi:retrotransposon Gag-like protein 6 [Paroedura picta]|uniref:retrotransposon Gag-like protein 6 n=1 Tax=Paroedura picta TaxID=143630 RepID=UPI004056BB17